MTTKFFTNSDENNLIKKFEGVLTYNPNIQYFDAFMIIFKPKTLLLSLFLVSIYSYTYANNQDSSFKQFLSWQKNINQKIWVITKNQIDTNDKIDGKWFSFWGNTLIFGEDQSIEDLKSNFHIDSISRNCFLVLFDTLLNERKNDPKQMIITFNESGITDDGYNNPIQKIIEIRLDSYRLIAESSGNKIPSTGNWRGEFTNTYQSSIEINSTTPSYSPNSIKIGSIVWTNEDFKTNKYLNDEQIPRVYDDLKWEMYSRFKIGCFRVLPNGAYVYNYYALNDSRGIVPLGYRLPQKNDFDSLLKIVNDREKDLLKYSYNTGDPINNKVITYTNSTGFSATKGGFVYSAGNPQYGSCSYYWTSDFSKETITDEFTLYEQDIFKYYFYSLGNCSQDLGQSELIEMGFGMSIRLIKVLP